MHISKLLSGLLNSMHDQSREEMQFVGKIDCFRHFHRSNENPMTSSIMSSQERQPSTHTKQ